MQIRFGKGLNFYWAGLWVDHEHISVTSLHPGGIKRHFIYWAGASHREEEFIVNFTNEQEEHKPPGYGW